MTRSGFFAVVIPALLVFSMAGLTRPVNAADSASVAKFRQVAQPLLNKYCVSCHNAEFKKGSVDFDQDDPTRLAQDQELWLKALKMLQADMMPPKGKRRPSAQQLAELENWIKFSVFAIDPQNPDPGRVTIRRLNRTEYHNTVRDLLGVEFNASAEFPADDTGHGFDNISDVSDHLPASHGEIHRGRQVNRGSGRPHPVAGAGGAAPSRPPVRDCGSEEFRQRRGTAGAVLLPGCHGDV